jgi:ParB family transcriptional regulator, chromosome partitioning protein
MPDIHQIPLAAVDAEAVSRDRTRLDPDAFEELRQSIARTGLRQPIEVFALAEPRAGCTYGLISGFRRLRACRALAEADPARGVTKVEGC